VIKVIVAAAESPDTPIHEAVTRFTVLAPPVRVSAVGPRACGPLAHAQPPSNKHARLQARTVTSTVTSTHAARSQARLVQVAVPPSLLHAIRLRQWRLLSQVATPHPPRQRGARRAQACDVHLSFASASRRGSGA
jgi:hypothetical protein